MFAKRILLLIIAVFVLAGCDGGENIAQDMQTDILYPDDMKAKINRNISVAEAQSLIASNSTKSDFVVLDVRTPDEFNVEHLKKAVNADYKSNGFVSSITNLDKTATYLVYCRSGRRSAESMQIMESLGFENVYNLEGGIIAWKEAGGEVIP